MSLLYTLSKNAENSSDRVKIRKGKILVYKEVHEFFPIRNFGSRWACYMRFYPWQALNLGFFLLITKIRPLRRTILQSLSRFFLDFKELNSFITHFLYTNIWLQLMIKHIICQPYFCPTAKIVCKVKYLTYNTKLINTRT